MSPLSFQTCVPVFHLRTYGEAAHQTCHARKLILTKRKGRFARVRVTACAQMEPPASPSNETPPEDGSSNGNALTSGDATASPDDGAAALEGEDDWFAVSKSIARPDDGRPPPQARGGGANEVVDLLALENAGRQVLAVGSYESVVDVDVDQGGIFEEDEDNNHLLSGVGFDALVDSPALLENLSNDFKIETLTHVQLAAIPRILDGRDLVMQSYTGTGKTLAFLLPILDDIDTTLAATQAMVVAPTRELAMQISRECDRLIVNTGIRNLALIGGANPVRQVDKLRRGGVPHIVVGTPGRLAEHAESGDLRTRLLDIMVVDEIDQCLVGEFGEQVQRLLRTVPKTSQKVLVSATGDVNLVRNFAGNYMDDPVLLRVGGALRVPQNIEHWMCVVPSRLKIETVRKILFANPKPDRAIVFVDEPRRVEIVAERLWHMGVAVGALKGTAYKTDRKETLDAFRKGRVQVLVSTEVAARGLDVLQMTHVINLDLPTDADHYVHRAGRCGRAGRQGFVVSIASSEHAFVLGKMSKQIGMEIRRMEVRDGEYRSPLERRVDTRQTKNDARQAKGGRGKVEVAKPMVSSASSVEHSTNAKVENVSEGKVKSKPKVEPKAKSKTKSKTKARADDNKVRKPKSPRKITEIAKEKGWVGNR